MPLLNMVHLIALSPTVDPELSFKQAEALFTAHNISHEKMKFGHIVRVLAVQYALEVRKIILRAPEAS